MTNDYNPEEHAWLPDSLGIMTPSGVNIRNSFFFLIYLIYNVILVSGIKIAGRNINNLRYADDITLMAESEEERKSFLMKVKE